MKQQIIDRFPGISCAWADAAGKETTEYYGFADMESHTYVDGETIFPACSISKFITAICVMRLHEQKLIDIDMPVNRYLRQWKLLTADGSESDADIRSILCHTAGIPDGEDAFYGLRRGDPEISLTDILEGRTSYNNRPARAEKPQGTAFEYSDAGYCVLQLLAQEVTHKPFDDITRELLFDPLGLCSTFFATPANTARFEDRMATGYDDSGLPIPGRFPQVPDLAASGLWSTPQELLAIAKGFVKALNGQSSFLQPESAREMAKPVEVFPWTGLGVFTGGEDILVSNGWGENGQCMMKMNCRTGKISVVMTNRNPGVDQAESGVEWLADRIFSVE
ncbi:MAG: serine hydrolase domain-containing protein [Clostridia bacterium]